MHTHLYMYMHLHNDSEWVFFDVGLQVNSRAIPKLATKRPALSLAKNPEKSQRQLKSPRTAPAPPDALAVGNSTS